MLKDNTLFFYFVQTRTRTLAGRLVERLGLAIQTDIDGLTHVFPKPEKVLSLTGAIENHLGPMEIITTRAKTIKELAQLFVQDKIGYDLCTEIDKEVKNCWQYRELVHGQQSILLCGCFS